MALHFPRGVLVRPTMLQAGATLTGSCLLQDVSGVLIVTWMAHMSGHLQAAGAAWHWSTSIHFMLQAGSEVPSPMSASAAKQTPAWHV